MLADEQISVVQCRRIQTDEELIGPWRRRLRDILENKAFTQSAVLFKNVYKGISCIRVVHLAGFAPLDFLQCQSLGRVRFWEAIWR